MAIQYDTTHRNNNVADITTQAGTTAYLLIYTGSPPANCATAATGTLLASLPMSNPIAGTPSGGVLTMSAITSEAASATGTAGYWRICTSSAGTTCVAQGLVYPTSTLTTSAATASGNVLTFASTSGLAVGQTVAGTNIPAGTYILDLTSTTVTMNQNVTSTGVASGATITFGGDLSFPSASFTAGVTIGVSSFTITANGA